MNLFILEITQANYSTTHSHQEIQLLTHSIYMIQYSLMTNPQMIMISNNSKLIISFLKCALKILFIVTLTFTIKLIMNIKNIY